MWSVSKSTHWQINTSCSCKILCSWGFSRKYLVWLETPWKQGWAGTVLPKVTDNPLHMERSLNLLFLSPAAAFPLIRQQINSLYPSSVERHFGRWAFPNDYLGSGKSTLSPMLPFPGDLRCPHSLFLQNFSSMVGFLAKFSSPVARTRAIPEPPRKMKGAVLLSFLAQQIVQYRLPLLKH